MPHKIVQADGNPRRRCRQHSTYQTEERHGYTRTEVLFDQPLGRPLHPKASDEHKPHPLSCEQGPAQSGLLSSTLLWSLMLLLAISRQAAPLPIDLTCRDKTSGLHNSCQGLLHLEVVTTTTATNNKENQEINIS